MRKLNDFVILQARRNGELGYKLPEKFDGNKRTFEEFMDLNNISDNDILDIDISNHNIGLWEDGASEGKYNVYTYEAIPMSLIRFVDSIDTLF